MSQQHERTKRIIRIIGIVFIVLGAGCSIAGFVDLFISMNGDGMPTLIFLEFIGLPMFGIGLVLLLFSLHREIARYAKNEAVPVINEASQELSPAIRAVAAAAKGTPACPHCGAPVQESNAFCPSCGQPLTKTCPHCGTAQPAHNAFCGNCGEKL